MKMAADALVRADSKGYRRGLLAAVSTVKRLRRKTIKCRADAVNDGKHPDCCDECLIQCDRCAIDKVLELLEKRVKKETRHE